MNGGNKTARSRPKPFYDRTWFKGLGAVVIVIGGLLTIFSGILTNIVQPWWAGREAAGANFENVEIVLDSSKTMQDPFEGDVSKLNAAVTALESVLRSQGLAQSNLAYREFGGKCDDPVGQTPPTVPFGRNNAEHIRARASDLAKSKQIVGEATTLVDAIYKAVGDFRDNKLMQKPVVKRVIVITGNSDACNLDLAELRKRLPPTVELDFRFIAVGVAKSDEAQLNEIAKVTNGEVRYAYDQKQLTAAVQHVVLEEPGHSAADAMFDILESSAGRLNPLTDDLANRKFDSGEQHLREARAEFDRTEVPFQVLSSRQSDERYQTIFRAAAKQRDLQRQILALGDTMVSQARNGDRDRFVASQDQYNKLIDAYNPGAVAFAALLKQLQSPPDSK